MRPAVTLPLSLLAGIGAGLAFFRGPSALPPAASAALRESARPTDPDAPSDSPATTDAKTQRLLAAALRKGRRLDCDNDLYLAIEAFTADDFRRFTADDSAVKTLAEKLRGIGWETRRALAGALLGHWLALDPAAALAAIPHLLEITPAKDGARGELLDALAAKRPAELLALVPSRKDAAERAEIISRALRELAEHDPAKAREWLATCTDPADRRVAEKAIRLGAVRADPLRAVALADSLEDRGEGRDLLEAAAQRAAKMGAGVLRQLATAPLKPWMLSSILNELAARDPALAVDLAVKSAAAGNTNIYGLQSAFYAFARRDPAQAIARLEGLTGQVLAAAVSATGAEWAQRDPAVALAWLAQRPKAERINPNGETNYGTNDALLMAFGGWAGRAKDEARAWADALPAGEYRNAVQAQFARALADRGEPAEATQVLARIGSAADAKAIREVAGAWAQRDPHAAADWVIAQEPGPAQNSALAGIVGVWAKDEPHAVEDWLAQFPAGEARDRSIGAFLDRRDSWASGSAERSAEFDAWFDLIDDPWRRAQVARSSFWRRKERDPAAARGWLSALPNLDPEVVRMLLRDNRD